MSEVRTFARRKSNVAGFTRRIFRIRPGHVAALRLNSRRPPVHHADQCAALSTFFPISVGAGRCGVSAVSYEPTRTQRCIKWHALKAPPLFLSEKMTQGGSPRPYAIGIQNIRQVRYLLQLLSAVVYAANCCRIVCAVIRRSSHGVCWSFDNRRLHRR